MGTFIGHFVPGLAFTLLGIWHTICTIKCYKLKGPSHFSSTTWFPINSRNHFIKHLELYLLFTFSIVVILLQLLVNYDHEFEALNYEHATMYLHVALYSLLAILIDQLSPSSNSLPGLVTTLAASVFAQELFLLHFHSADHVGLEGHYHWLLQLIVAATLVATFLSGISSNSFPAAMVRCGCVILQGWWFMVMGFALWVPRLMPSGCQVEKGEVACASEEITKRAMAVANLELSWAVAGVWVVLVFLSLKLEWKLEYRQLQGPGTGPGPGPAVSETDDGLKQAANRLDNI